MKPLTIAENFDANWIEDAITGCFVWSRSCKGKEAASGGGYGCFRLNKKTKGAHVFAYERVNGLVPKGMHVMHSCDNTKCVNPKHLSLGTNAENAADKLAKGRYPSKLSVADVVDIKRSVAAGVVQRVMAEKYGIKQGDVSHICSGHYWSHVNA